MPDKSDFDDLWALIAERDRLRTALELAQSHIGWCWDVIERNTKLQVEGSKNIHDKITAALAKVEGKKG